MAGTEKEMAGYDLQYGKYGRCTTFTSTFVVVVVLVVATASVPETSLLASLLLSTQFPALSSLLDRYHGLDGGAKAQELHGDEAMEGGD